MAARPLKETGGLWEGAQPKTTEGCVRQSLRGLARTPGKTLAEGALGAPRTWKRHLQVPVRRQMRGAQPGAASQAAVRGTRKVCVLS